MTERQLGFATNYDNYSAKVKSPSTFLYEQYLVRHPNSLLRFTHAATLRP